MHCDFADHRSAAVFLDLLSSYLQDNLAEADGLDLLDVSDFWAAEIREADQKSQSDKLRPIAGVTSQSAVSAGAATVKENGLLDFNDDGSDDVEQPQTFEDIIGTTHWKPSQGAIAILTLQIAQKLSSNTGCDLFLEPQQNRVRIVGGDFEKCKEYLTTLEDLLVRLCNLVS